MRTSNQDIIQAELVEEAEPAPPWEWREVRPVRPRRRRVWLPAILFIATCLSTFATGIGDPEKLDGFARLRPASGTPCR